MVKEKLDSHQKEFISHTLVSTKSPAVAAMFRSNNIDGITFHEKRPFLLICNSKLEERQADFDRSTSRHPARAA